ncbi:MAG: hypothetical protein NTU53_11235 [Planctomycetota bacterium]|nr:hypothetical protein [Planctomycetota bacterium]
MVIGAQAGDGLVDRHAITIPSKQPPTGKAVTQIMNPGLGKDAVAAPPKFCTQVTEGAAHRAVRQGPALSPNEEGPAPAVGRVPITTGGVTAQDPGDGGMHRDEPGLAELGLAGVQDSLLEIHIGPLQCEALGDTQACAGQQTEESCVGRRTQRVDGRQSAGGGKQFAQLQVGVDMWLLPTITAAQQVPVWHLALAIPDGQVAGKAADDGKTISLIVERSGTLGTMAASGPAGALRRRGCIRGPHGARPPAFAAAKTG